MIEKTNYIKGLIRALFLLNSDHILLIDELQNEYDELIGLLNENQ